ncbi:alkaline phosphatase PhoX [Pedococcus sp. NPDC057267]|uniref:alkaline phosphatase PhoX n=1 Tax=Pedococcus sp. NPDC057267 TaxID=3346077 RepID=UPI0036342B16
MKTITKASAASVTGTALIGAVLALGSGSATAESSTWVGGDVAAPNARVGVQDNVLAAGLRTTPVAWGGLGLTNADTAAGITHYGYDTANGGPLTQDQKEAFKTEPDKNVYLAFAGHHYLYQGHEGGPRGYVTRIDLDQPDPGKRVSLMSDSDPSGGALPTFDGITWNPFTRQLMLTAEAKAPHGGVWALSLDAAGDPVTGKAVGLPALGSGGYEGIQNDSAGNVWLVEDIGGASVSGGKKPNSFVYRFVPSDRSDLTAGGTLQALQVQRRDGSPITAAQLAADPASSDIAALHDPRRSFASTWVDVHSGTAAFDATASAAAAEATPFKRPENGVFRPGTGFGEFYFTETGDTSTSSTLPGAYGGVFRISQSSPSADTGRVSIVAVGDKAHSGLDNIAFAGRDDLLVVEDAGDGLHQQRNALDSGYRIDLRRAVQGDRRGARMTRWLAEGRDASALYDATTSPGYNDGDNEITGIHVSDGDPSVGGLLGARLPRPFDGTWRVFWTQQHGDNVTWELTGGADRR